MKSKIFIVILIFLCFNVYSQDNVWDDFDRIVSGIESKVAQLEKTSAQDKELIMSITDDNIALKDQVVEQAITVQTQQNEINAQKAEIKKQRGQLFNLYLLVFVLIGLRLARIACNFIWPTQMNFFFSTKLGKLLDKVLV